MQIACFHEIVIKHKTTTLKLYKINQSSKSTENTVDVQKVQSYNYNHKETNQQENRAAKRKEVAQDVKERSDTACPMRDQRFLLAAVYHN